MTERTGVINWLQSLSGIASRYDAIICDLWGVIHDGVKAHPPAVTCLQNLSDLGIPTVLLSNAPRPLDHVQQQLRDLDVPQHLTRSLMTSGELSRRIIKSDHAGRKIYHLGPESDANLCAGLPADFVPQMAEADVILASGLDYPDAVSHKEDLLEAAAREVPFICANPDRVVHVGSDLWLCAGVVGDLYESIGGHVVWAGKPDPMALQAALGEISAETVSPERVLVIGDGLHTDIRGANACGYDSLLVADGIHRDRLSGYDKAIERTRFPDIMHGDKDMPIPGMIIRNLVW